VDTRAEYVTTIRGIVRARGEELPECDTYSFARKLRDANLTEATRVSIAPIEATLVMLDQQIALADVALDAMCRADPVIGQLMTTPGVGAIVAAAFVSAIDEAKRFSNAHQVESYLGLVPCEQTTGGRDRRRLGSITKNGNAYARTMLVEAACVILRSRRDNPLREWARAVVARRGKRIATIALARRLAGVLWALWRDGTVYDSARAGVVIARGIARHAQSRQLTAEAVKRAAKKLDKRARRSARKLSTLPTQEVP